MTPVVTFFNNKGGLAKTSLVYHLAWMYAAIGIRVLAVDLDPQANLTEAFFDEDLLEELLWPSNGLPQTVYATISPLLRGTGDIGNTHIVAPTGGIAVAPGDLSLSSFEDELSAQWSACLDGRERAFRVTCPYPLGRCSR